MEFTKYLNKADDLQPEFKKDHELNTDDRMHLINKKIDDKFLLEIYENLIEKKNYIKTKGIQKIKLKIY